MRFRIKLTILFCILFMLFFHSEKVSAQYDAQLSQYMLAPGTFNPAFTGQGSDLNISLINRQQWVGVENAPRPFYSMLPCLSISTTKKTDLGSYS